jgi:hypothetical protein
MRSVQTKTRTTSNPGLATQRERAADQDKKQDQAETEITSPTTDSGRCLGVSRHLDEGIPIVACF